MKNPAIMETFKNNFLNLPDYCDFKSSKFIVIPFGYELTTTYAGGTANGPKAIIKASAEVELFDEVIGQEPYKNFGIATLKNFKIPKNRKAAFNRLEEKIVAVAELDKIPVILGGEHSITLPAISGLKKKYGDIIILHFDAHSDLRPSYKGDSLSHACAMHSVLPYVSHLISLGIRNTSVEEAPVIKNNKNKIKIYWARDIKKNGIQKIIMEILPILKNKNVFLSFDVDVFDISLIGSSTGTPEPCGLDYCDIIKCFEAILPEVNLIGADFVELRPIKNFHAPDFLIAKTIYKALTAASI